MEMKGFAWFYNYKQSTTVVDQSERPPAKQKRQKSKRKRNKKPPRRTNFFYVLGLGLLIIGGVIFIAAFVIASLTATATPFFGPIVTWFVIVLFLSSFSLLFLLPGAIMTAIGVRYNDRRDGINKPKKYQKQKNSKPLNKKAPLTMTSRQYNYNKKKNRPYLGIGIAFAVVGSIFLFAHLLGASLLAFPLLLVILLTAVGVALLINYFMQVSKLKKVKIID